MEYVRRIGAVVLIIAAFGVWFGMAPATDDSAGAYRAGITAALAADTENNKNTQGAPQQAVVNGWTAKDLLTVIAQEGSSRDERPAALLVLVIVGLALGLATSGAGASDTAKVSRSAISEPYFADQTPFRPDLTSTAARRES